MNVTSVEKPAEVILPGKFHGQRSVVGYSPWSHRELDMTEKLTHAVGLWEIEEVAKRSGHFQVCYYQT